MAKGPIMPGLPTPSNKEISGWNKALKELKNKRENLKKELNKTTKDQKKIEKLTKEEWSLRVKVAKLPPIAFHYVDKKNISYPVN